MVIFCEMNIDCLVLNFFGFFKIVVWELLLVNFIVMMVNLFGMVFLVVLLFMNNIGIFVDSLLIIMVVDEIYCFCRIVL